MSDDTQVKLYISGLPPDYTKRKVQRLFKRLDCGNVLQNVVLFYDKETKQPKCSGLAVVSPASASSTVIETANGAVIDDHHKLNIRIYRENQRRSRSESSSEKSTCRQRKDSDKRSESSSQKSRQRRDSHQRTKSKQSKEVSAPKKQWRSTIILDNFPDYLGEDEIEAITDFPGVDITINTEKKCAVLVLPKDVDAHHIWSKWDGKVFLGESIHAYIVDEEDQSQDREQQSESSLFDTETSIKPQSRRRRRERGKDKHSTIHQQEGDKDRIKFEVCSVPSVIDRDELSVPVHSLNGVNHDCNEQLIKEPHSAQKSESEEDMSGISAANRQGNETAEHHIHFDTKKNTITTGVNPKATNVDDFSCLPREKEMPIIKQVPSVPANINTEKDFTNAVFHINCIMSKENFIKFMQHHLNSAILNEVEVKEVKHNQDEQSSSMIVQFSSLDTATSAIEQLQNNSDLIGEICEPEKSSAEVLFKEKISEFKLSIESKSKFFLAKHNSKTEMLTGERKKQNIPKRCPAHVFQDITAKREVLDQAIVECNRQHTEFITYCTHLNTRLNELEVEAEVLTTDSERKKASEQSLSEKLSNLRKRFGNECSRLERALPMYAYRTHILEVIQKQGHQVIILIGETGSGKSTQLVQYIHEHEVASSGIIVCTQPRKVAAISLAKHVSTEMGVALGQTLGYKTGLRGNNSEKTKVIYMTDHTLLNECIADPTFSKYSCLIIDEAHERSLSTDLLLAFIKKCLPKRPDLKVIITSATIDPEIFDEYFGGSCPIIKVPGRTYPVEIVWNPLKSDKSPLDRDYVSDCVNIACHLNASEPPGDILVFLTSAAEIERACQSTTDKLGNNAIVLPLHGKLPPEEQQKVFQVDDQRKIVFATNVAETSVTIPGVKYIVDTGLAKELCFDPKKNMNSLEVRIISKSSAEQRKGRAGRTSAGKCYRLYSEAQYSEMPSKSLPEILRVTLETTALKLHEFGVADVLSFDFVEEPDRTALVKAVENLQFLEAIRDGHLTELGKKMAALPIDPHLSRIMLDGINWGIGLEAAVSAAISTLAGSVFFRAGTDEMKQECDMKTITFCHPAGDQMTYLQTYFQWATQERANQNKWCVEHYVNAKSMRMVRELVKEFRDILRLQFNIILEDHPFNPDITEEVLPKLYFDTFIRNICIFLGHERVGYLNVNLPNERLFIFHGSPLRQLNVVPKLLVYEKTLVTSQHFLLQALPVRAEWIYEAIESGKLPCHPSDTALYNQNCVVPVMASNLGKNSLRRLQKNWKSKKTILDITKPVEPQVDYDYKQGAMKVFVPICHQDLVSQLLLAEVSEIKNELKGEICEKGVTKDDDSVRVILTCGVSVKYVLMPDQYRTVMIKGASAGTIYREEILQVLKQFGVIERESRNFKNDHQLFVTFTNPDSACEAVKSFQDQPVLPDVVIQPYTPYQRQQDSISAFTLHVEWCRRARKQHAFVNFDNEEDFCIAKQRFCIPGYAAVYRVHSMKFRPSKDGKAQLFVTNVNLYVTEDQIKEAIQTHLPEVSDDKFKVLIGYEKSFETTPQQLKELKQKLDELVSPYAPSGKYRVFLNQPKHFFKTYKAQIKFENPDEGYSALKHIQFASIENHVLSVKAELSSTVRYSSEVYSVVEKSIQEVTNEIHSRYRSVRVDHGKKDDKDKIIVRITSEDVNTFIIAKHALNSVISPFIINCSKPELREFIQTANCKRALEKIEAETSTYIRIDTRRATISMYGYESNITKAQIEFNKCLSFLDYGAKCFEVRLKEAGRPPGLMKHLVSLFGPGLRQLQEREGVTTVRLDPRRQLVTVFATQQVYEFLNGKIDEYTKSFDPNLLSTIHHHKSDELECCACFTDIRNSSDIFRLEYCGHTYCIDCIKLQLAPSTVDFPIVCAADGCSEALVWKDVYNLSDQTGFSIRHLINASVKSYVAANQDKVRNCPSPDCSMIYSVTKEGKCFFCQQCGAMVCTTCHEPYHEGITCAMYQSGKQADKDLENWLQRDPSNRKRCPKCSSPIEKTYGCNHVACTQCRVHICWFCLDYFYSEVECYDHMSAKHGNFGP